MLMLEVETSPSKEGHGGSRGEPPPSNIMETTQPQQAKDWTFQLAIGHRLITVAVPPRFLLVVMLAGLLGFLLGSQRVGAHQRRQTARLAALEQKAQELERSLASKQAERDEMATLAERRLEELAQELTDREHELTRLWSIIGRAPREEQRRASLASRSGQRAPQSVQGRYQELKSKLEAGRDDLSRLSVAAAVLHRQRQAEAAKRIPSGVPCQGEMTSGFGGRVHPVYGIGRHHNGCDFTTDYGTPIRATASGKVASADWLGGYGQAVEIDHGNGLKTLYAHCETLRVKKGQSVRKGQVIATVGTTGLSSGPHCHYEVHKDGKAVDPLAYLPPGTAKKAKE